MSQESSNVEWLRVNTPRALYAAHGIRKQNNLRIVGGKVYLPPDMKTNRADETVYFGDFFTVGCQPVITNSVVTTNRKIECTIDGIGLLHPDHRGFQVHVMTDVEIDAKNIFDRPVYVNWIALGY